MKMKIGLKDIYKNTYNNDTKACEVGHEHNQEVIHLCKNIVKMF